jgi:hypothetical protein
MTRPRPAIEEDEILATQGFRETLLVRMVPRQAEALRELGRILFYATDAGKDDPRARCRAVVRELRHLEGSLRGMVTRMLSEIAERADERKEKLVRAAKRRANELGEMAQGFEREIGARSVAHGSSSEDEDDGPQRGVEDHARRRR